LNPLAFINQLALLVVQCVNEKNTVSRLLVAPWLEICQPVGFPELGIKTILGLPIAAHKGKEGFKFFLFLSFFLFFYD